MNAEETRKKMLVFIMGTTQNYTANVKYDEEQAHDYVEMTYPQGILIDKKAYDRILVLGTAEALNLHYKPFVDFIRKHYNREVEIKDFEIPKLSNQDEFWNTFIAFTNEVDCMNLENEWDIDVDLTNGYRSQPMFILEIIRFFCIMNESKCHLGHQHYGAYTIRDEKNPIARTDYYDMTTISELASMARDINDFLKYNQAEGLVNWLRRICEVESDNEKARQLQQTMRVIQNTALKFSNVVSMNITPMAASVIKELCEAIEQLDNTAVTPQSGALYPFVMAMKHLRDELRGHLPKGINPLWRWQLALCEWCLDRKLYQQAATQAEELVTTKIAETYAMEKLHMTSEKAIQYALDFKGVREQLGTYICNRCESFASKKYRHDVNVSPYYRELNSLINRNKEDGIVKLRNNLNHAFMRNDKIDIENQKDKIVSCVKSIVRMMKEQEFPADLMDAYCDFIDRDNRKKRINDQLRDVVKEIIDLPEDDMELIQKIKDFIVAQSNGTAQK